jgi:hypothetical protein
MTPTPTPTFPRVCGTCSHFQPVADRGECHAALPTATGWPRVEHESRPCERYSADVTPVVVALDVQRAVNVQLARRLAAASEVLGRAAERRVRAEEWSEGAGI